MQPSPLEGPETELDARSTIWREIVQRHPEALVIVNQRGLIRFANEAASKLFGQRPEDLKGRLLYPASSNMEEVGILHPDVKRTVEVHEEPLAGGEGGLRFLMLEEPPEANDPLADAAEDEVLSQEASMEEALEPNIPPEAREPLGFEGALDLTRDTLAGPLDQMLGTRTARMRLPHTRRTRIRHRRRRRFR